MCNECNPFTTLLVCTLNTQVCTSRALHCNYLKSRLEPHCSNVGCKLGGPHALRPRATTGPRARLWAGLPYFLTLPSLLALQSNDASMAVRSQCVTFFSFEDISQSKLNSLLSNNWRLTSLFLLTYVRKSYPPTCGQNDHCS